jgi:6,7-dimethyl-8-ribityllumazine synthase
MEKKHNLSEVTLVTFPGINSIRIAIVTADWNPDVTHSMRDAAIEYLLACGILRENILNEAVPGSFELPLGARLMLDREDIDGVVCIGCIIQGETKHFDFIANAVAHGIMKMALEHNAPVSFGVLTTQNQLQALDRAGGKHGNKGIEAAHAVMAMLKLKASGGQL